MYHIQMAFTLIRVGTNLWINPVQVQGIVDNPSIECPTIIILHEERCSDWPIEKVKAALSPAAISRAMEAK